MTKLQITLTDQETQLLSQKAEELGYDVTKYAKFVLAREAEGVLSTIPVVKSNSKTRKLIQEAISEDDQYLTKKWPIPNRGN